MLLSWLGIDEQIFGSSVPHNQIIPRINAAHSLNGIPKEPFMAQTGAVIYY